MWDRANNAQGRLIERGTVGGNGNSAQKVPVVVDTTNAWSTLVELVDGNNPYSSQSCPRDGAMLEAAATCTLSEMGMAASVVVAFVGSSETRPPTELENPSPDSKTPAHPPTAGGARAPLERTAGIARGTRLRFPTKLGRPVQMAQNVTEGSGQQLATQFGSILNHGTAGGASFANRK